MSKEDLWPVWTRAYLPVTQPNYSFARSVLEKDRRLHGTVQKISGDPKSRRVKVVCRRCNNNWMSILQNRAKPMLLPLMHGEKSTLNERKQSIIAAWAAMVVICAEYIAPGRAAMSVVDRRHLYLHKQAPPRIRIWIGNFRRKNWPAYWCHNSLLIGPDKAPYPWQIGPGGLPWPNTQMTTLTFGSLYLHAFSCPFPEILGGFEPRRSHVVQIWPIREKFIVWPPTATIDDRAADGIAGAIFNKLDSIGVAMGY
ncbi:MAG TPA: hypothetical protein VIY51_09695 [Xanthobacteraceae bacterium]